MIKRGDKTGQFYLIAAIILATLIIGIVTISNYAKKESNLKLHALKEEIQIESAYVLDYGLLKYKSSSEAEFYTLLLNFTKNYIDYQGQGKDLYFIFGDQNNITVTGYQELNKRVSLDGSVITTSSGEFIGGIDPTGTDIILTINDSSYDFEIKSGENFYFILSQEVNKGEYIITG
jgi:hypothetical protein